MEKGKFESAEGRKRRTPGTKSIALLLALALLAGGAVGGTLAWLLDSTDKIENTFSPSSIDVTLSETTQAYKMVPGWTIAKDPKVQISADSEDCYLFIKVEKTGGNVTIDEKTYGEEKRDSIQAAIQRQDSINKVIIPQIPTRLEMLQNGKLAAATLPEPMASIAVHNGCQFVTGSDELGINPGVIMFTAKTTNDRRAEIAAMYRAYNKAVDYLNNTPREEYIDLIVEKGGFPPAAKEALKLPEYHHATLPKESDVVDCVKWLQGKGLIQKNYTYADFVVDVLSK